MAKRSSVQNGVCGSFVSVGLGDVPGGALLVGLDMFSPGLFVIRLENRCVHDAKAATAHQHIHRMETLAKIAEKNMINKSVRASPS